MTSKKTDQPIYRPAPLTKEQISNVPTHCDCGAELHFGDCPACDLWPEDDFDD